MFKPLGLLSKVACPISDRAQCEASRSQCPFSHDPPPAPRPSASSSSSSSSSSKPTTTASATPAKALPSRIGMTQASVRNNLSLGSKRASEPEPSLTPASSAPPTKKSRNAYSSSGSSATATARTDDWQTVALKPPTISFNKHPSNSKIPLSSRQGALKSIFASLTTVYSPLLESENSIVRATAQRLAHDHALAQELDIFTVKDANKMTYKNSSVTILVGLKKRDPETIQQYAERAARAAAENADAEGGQAEKAVLAILQECPETGTAMQVMAKKTELEGRIKGRLTRERLANAAFICPKGDLPKYDYMFEIPAEWQAQGGTEPDSVGQTKECQRCGKHFIVGGKMNEEGTERIPQDKNECRFHWGRKRFEKVPGSKGKTQIWLCCNRPVESTALGDASCCLGPHVFKEDDPKDLHRRESFITTRELTESLGGDTSGHLDIVAVDCELCFTTAGMSLTRLTLISEDGSVILDELVRSRAEIVDYNTRFSGIQPEEYEEKAVLDLASVRRAMGRFMGEKTILVGHGLENDLRALRLVHTVIVDTALLFQHPKGPPFKLSLRELTSRHLGKIIQNSGASVGHSSAEDAQMALELVRWKILNQPTSPFGGGEGEQKPAGADHETPKPAAVKGVSVV